MKISELTMDELNTNFLPWMEQAFVVSSDVMPSFCVVLCAATEEQAKREKVWLEAQWNEPYLPQVVEQPRTDGIEQSICFETIAYSALVEDLSADSFRKLLQADFMLWFDSGNYTVEDVIPVAAASGDLFWLVTDETKPNRELSEVADGFCHTLLAQKGCCRRSGLVRSLHGLICVKGRQIRRRFRRQALKACCEQGKKEIREKILIWQEKRNKRFLQQMAYYYKFLRHWNGLDNDLSERGNYYQTLRERIEAEKQPENFGARMTEMARAYSKEYFDKWQQTFLHANGWSVVCGQISSDFSRVVWNESLSDARIIGYEKQTIWESLLRRPKKARYNRYREQALAELRNRWIPDLRSEAKRILTAYDAEYRSLVRTYDKDWEEWSDVYLQMTKLQKQLPEEQLR